MKLLYRDTCRYNIMFVVRPIEIIIFMNMKMKCSWWLHCGLLYGRIVQ